MVGIKQTLNINKKRTRKSMITKITCFECDSEYQIHSQQGCLTDDIRYCIVCGSEIETEIDDEEEIEDEE
jgi:predicted nucleic acid-binding Zn ribbon protein